MFTQKKLAEVGSFALSGLFGGWLINEILLNGLFSVDLFSNTVAVIAGGVIGAVVGFLPKG